MHKRAEYSGILTNLDSLTQTQLQQWLEAQPAPQTKEQAYPQMDEFHPQFLLISMGAIESAFQYNWPIARWIDETRKANGVA